jgi:hypothetical protein
VKVVLPDRIQMTMVIGHMGTVGKYTANQIARMGSELTCGISTGAVTGGRDEEMP